MASSDERNARLGSEIVICAQCKAEINEIKQCDFFSKESNVKNNNELQNLQEDMKELRDLLKTAKHRPVKEVILHEINMIFKEN
jgi:Fe-S cluster assembly ATPase SufC